MISRIIDKIVSKAPAKVRGRVAALRFPKLGKAFCAELAGLDVSKTGVEKAGDRELPYVVLGDGTKFFGNLPADLQQRMLPFLRREKIVGQEVSDESIGVVWDLVPRFLYPHAMPHLTPGVPRQERRYFHPQHVETIADLPDLKAGEIEAIQQRFKPREGDQVADLGAYIGMGAVRMAREVGKQGRIVALEADPTNFGILKANVEANDLGSVITPVHGAIWKSEGEVVTFQKGGEQRNSVVDGMIDALETVDVPTATLDGLVREHGLDGLSRVSCTVNGAEVEAFDGMKATLAGCPELRMSLAGWYRRDGKRIADILSPKLREAGMQVRIGRRGGVYAWKSADGDNS